MTIRSYARVVALVTAAAALIAGALALWLSAAPPSGAATADQPQGTTVTVTDNTISWGSAEGCVQSMGTADFGSALPGAFPQSTLFTGCVTSNASPWGVSASGTDLTLGGGGFSIPGGNLSVRTPIAPTGSATGASAPCNTPAA